MKKIYYKEIRAKSENAESDGTDKPFNKFYKLELLPELMEKRGNGEEVKNFRQKLPDRLSRFFNFWSFLGVLTSPYLKLIKLKMSIPELRKEINQNLFCT